LQKYSNAVCEKEIKHEKEQLSSRLDTLKGIAEACSIRKKTIGKKCGLSQGTIAFTRFEFLAGKYF